MNHIFLSSLLILSSILLSNLALYGIRKRELPGAFFFSILMLAMSIHSVAYAFELLNNTIDDMYFWIRIEYIGAAFYPTLIMLFAREYTDEKKLANKYILTLLLMINVVTLILVTTNSYHFLYYSSVGVTSSPGFPILALEKGNWYLVQVIVLYFSILYSVIIFIIRLKKTTGDYRKRITFMLIGLTIPLATSIVYMMDLSPINIDLSPFSYLFMSLFIALGLFRYNALFFTPITHKMIFNSIDEGVLVIDKNKLLIQFNHASTLFFPSLNKTKTGESINFIHELKDYDFDLNQETYAIDDKILRFKKINLESNRGIIYVINDITKSEQAKKQLEAFATEDALTGLYNRRYFMENFHKNGNDGVFVMIDIDYFKTINDTYGHAQGDQVLSCFGEKLKQFFHKHHVCRYGGEEFALFFENKDLIQISEKVKAFRKEIALENHTIKFTFSAGIAKYTNGHISKAMIEADKLLYDGKKNGRNQIMY